LLAVGAAVFAASTYLNRHVTPRYQYVPVALGMVALFASAGLLARRITGRPRGWRPGWRDPSAMALVILAVVVGIGFATTFRTRNLASAGPNVPVEIAARRAECDGAVPGLLFKISPLPTNGTPYDWQVVIPCDRLAP
jgi:drug/metabolite transporter (DMT)-like permease